MRGKKYKDRYHDIFKCLDTKYNNHRYVRKGHSLYTMGLTNNQDVPQAFKQVEHSMWFFS